jgi:hypothetical protein
MGRHRNRNCGARAQRSADRPARIPILFVINILAA